jgi:4-hydroxy-tetrahydrodipicolinate synthase
VFKPQGIYAAMLTPFTDDGNVNDQVVRQMVDFLAGKGLDGLFPVSSVGEFVHLSLEQSLELMDIVVHQAAGRLAVTPGVSSSCVKNSIRLAQRAKELGCEAVVLCPPYYYTLDQDTLLKHFETVIDSVDIPVILYNIPLFTTPISAEVVVKLASKANVVGLKDSSGSMVELMHHMDRIRQAGSSMSLLTGREDMLAPALAVGIQGCMTACAGIVPEVLTGIWNAFYAGEWEKAKRLQFALLPVIRAMFSVPFPAGFKAAMSCRGFSMGPLLQPLSTAEEARLATVKASLQTAIDELLRLVEREEQITSEWRGRYGTEQGSRNAPS